MNERCDRCCMPLAECRCVTSFLPHRCYHCGGKFEVGQQYKSDAPGVVYHAQCYVKTIERAHGIGGEE